MFFKNPRQTGMLIYYRLPLVIMYTAQVLVAGFLLFDRSLALLQGIAMISLALACIFLRKLTRTMIRKNARMLSATEITIAVLLECDGKLDDELYQKLVRKHFNEVQFKSFVSADLDVDKVAQKEHLKSQFDLMCFYMLNLAKIEKM